MRRPEHIWRIFPLKTYVYHRPIHMLQRLGLYTQTLGLLTPEKGYLLDGESLTMLLYSQVPSIPS